MALSRALRDVLRKENGMVSKGKPGGDTKSSSGMAKKPPMNPKKDK